MPPSEKPVPAGWSTQITLALLFQECGLGFNVFPSSSTPHGPFSDNSAIIDEHPGPPVSQSTSGAFAGSFLDSNSQKKYDFSLSPLPLKAMYLAVVCVYVSQMMRG